MSQGILGFKYEAENHDTGMTVLAGLPIYLDLMHAMRMPQEKKRVAGKAFIPVPNEHLRGLVKVNRGVVSFIQRHSPQKTATLD